MREAELRVPSTLEAVAVATQQLRGLLPGWLSDSEADAIELAEGGIREMGRTGEARLFP